MMFLPCDDAISTKADGSSFFYKLGLTCVDVPF